MYGKEKKQDEIQELYDIRVKYGFDNQLVNDLLSKSKNQDKADILIAKDGTTWTRENYNVIKELIKYNVITLDVYSKYAEVVKK